jgi:hypothetical protein
MSYGDWPHGGCPDCNGLEVDCVRCNGTGYLSDPRDCAHKFRTNPGMYDTLIRYCTICGIAEPALAGRRKEASP